MNRDYNDYHLYHKNTSFWANNLRETLGIPSWVYYIAMLMPLLSLFTAVLKCIFFNRTPHKKWTCVKILLEILGLGFVELIIEGIGALIYKRPSTPNSPQEHQDIETTNIAGSSRSSAHQTAGTTNIAGFSHPSTDPAAHPSSAPTWEEWRVLDEILYDFICDNGNNKNSFVNWLLNHTDILDPNNFCSLPYERQCQLAVFLTEDIARLFANDCIENIRLNLDALMSNDLNRINTEFNDEARLIALATSINFRKIELCDVISQIQLIDHYLLLQELAPHLLYVSFMYNIFTCNILQLERGQENLQNFVNNCSNIVYLSASFTQIQALPDLPRCRTLFCVYCPNLTTIGNLPACRRLMIEECPCLTTINHNIRPPRLTYCSTALLTYFSAGGSPATSAFSNALNSSGPAIRPAIGTNRIYIDYAKVTNDPLECLSELWNNFLSNGSPFPSITYTNTHGIDAGGLSRDYCSRLFMNLFKPNKLILDTDHLPCIRDQTNSAHKEHYRAIGAIFACCYRNDNNKQLVTGLVFNKSLFDLIKLLSDENPSNSAWIESLFLLKLPNSDMRINFRKKLNNPNHRLSNNDQEYWNVFDIPSNYSKQQREKHLVAMAKMDSKLCPIHLIAHTMYNNLPQTFKDQFKAASSTQLSDRIQGFFSKELFLREIEWSVHSTGGTVGMYDTHCQQIKGYFNNWANTASEKNLQHLLFIITGSYSLIQGRKISLQIQHDLNTTEPRFPVAHTCFFRLDLDYKSENSQETFNDHMDYLLATESFQLS